MFVAHTEQNEIATSLSQAFVDAFGYRPPDSETRSWLNSLRALSDAIDLGRRLDHGLLLECQPPMMNDAAAKHPRSRTQRASRMNSPGRRTPIARASGA
jgi:exonuclease III